MTCAYFPRLKRLKQAPAIKAKNQVTDEPQSGPYSIHDPEY